MAMESNRDFEWSCWMRFCSRVLTTLVSGCWTASCRTWHSNVTAHWHWPNASSAAPGYTGQRLQHLVLQGKAQQHAMCGWLLMELLLSHSVSLFIDDFLASQQGSAQHMLWSPWPHAVLLQGVGLRSSEQHTVRQCFIAGLGYGIQMGCAAGSIHTWCAARSRLGADQQLSV